MHRRHMDPAAAPLDPQNLTLAQKIGSLLSLGRIPLASEVPLWCVFGCLLSSQVFSIGDNHPADALDAKLSDPLVSSFQNFDPWVALQCALIVWGTNLSINYGNEYFDYDMDRPGMVAGINRDLKARRDLEAKKKEIRDQTDDEEVIFEVEAQESQENAKIMGATTRIIHDGTFPPYTALLCSIFVQLLLLLLIVLSRHFDNYDPDSSNPTTPSPTRIRISPFRGAALYIGFVCTFLSQMYVGPPLRLHYNGFGELISALLLSPISALFGLIGHYTAVSGRPLSFSDLMRNISNPFTRRISSTSSPDTGFALDNQLVTLLLAFYFYEQARIFIMHIHDINADRRGGKITMTVRLGFTRASWLYVILNVVAVMLFARLGLQFGRIAISGASSAQGELGALNRIAGVDTTGTAAKFRATAWVIGILLVMGFAIPIMVITAKSLYAIDPSRRIPEGAKAANKMNEGPDIGNGDRIGEVNAVRRRVVDSNEQKRRGAADGASNGFSNGNGHHTSNGGESSRPSSTSTTGLFDFIPVLPHEVLAKIVSLQMLLTPVVLSISLAVGVRVAGV
jgi:1,4-dihydroxy-2-naphthoate octaprenyltransferase